MEEGGGQCRAGLATCYYHFLHCVGSTFISMEANGNSVFRQMLKL